MSLMLNKKSKGRAPRIPRQAEKLIAIRVPIELLDKIDAARGEIERSTWIRQLIDTAATSSDEVAIREVELYMERRGVTPAMLLSRRQKK